MSEDDQDGAQRQGRFGLVVAVLVMVIVVLGAIDLSRRFASRARPGEATDAANPVVSSQPVQQENPEVAGSGIRDAGRATASSATADSSDEPAPPAGRKEATGAIAPGIAAQPPSAGADSRANRDAAPPPAQKIPAAAEHGSAPPEEKPEPEKKSSAEFDASDRTPPTLSQLRFDPGVVEGGKATTLTIQAADNLSGVKSVRGEIQSPSGKAVLPLYLQESHGGESFTYVINIPPAAEAGVWFVKWLYLTDVADNSALIQVASAATAPPGGTFSVSSAESDSIAPDVLRISFARDVIENQERNVIRVEVHDDLSGVAAVSGACQSPSGSALISFKCALNEDSGLWEGDVLIPESADCGAWSVQQLAAKDKAGNTTQLAAGSPILAHASFMVARDTCDSSPPTLEGFVLSQAVVPGDADTEILLSAAVHDVGSGVASVTGWFEGPVSDGGQVPKNHFNCTPDPEHPEAPWTARLLVPQFAPKGTWKARVVRLEDKALNVREYTAADPVLSAATFEVR